MKDLILNLHKSPPDIFLETVFRRRIFVTDEKLQWARQRLRIANFEFDRDIAASTTAYEIAIKRLLNQYIALPIYQHSLISQPPLLSNSQMAEDAANILMAFKALEEGLLEKVSKHSAVVAKADKFIYVLNGCFRVHVSSLNQQQPMELVTSLSHRKCIGFFGQRPKLHQLDPETDHWWYWHCWTADNSIVDSFDPNVVAAYSH